MLKKIIIGITQSINLNHILFKYLPLFFTVSKYPEFGFPHENLFTEFEATTDFLSGGSQCAGPGSGARQTFWNMAPGFIEPPWARIQANIIGDISGEMEKTEDNEWIEPVANLQPINLYREQLARALVERSQDRICHRSRAEGTAQGEINTKHSTLVHDNSNDFFSSPTRRF